MEIFMNNIPIHSHREYPLKATLAKYLHGPDFPNIKANFQLRLFRPKKGAQTCSGTFILADLFVAERFLQIYGGQQPHKTIDVGGNHVGIQRSWYPPDPDVLDLLSRSRWVDPADELRQTERNQKLSSACLPLKVVQVGWACRDRVFSIEGETHTRNCNLSFDPERHEVHINFRRSEPQLNTHVIAIRQASILSVTAHIASGSPIVYFQLEVPPLFLHRKYDDKPYYRASVLPFRSLNPRATPYISLALRVVLTSRSDVEAFIDLAKTAGMLHIQKHQVATARRRLFSTSVLDGVEQDIKAFGWNVAFQLEAMLRNLDLDAQELLKILPTVRNIIATHGNDHTVDLLRKFSGRVHNLSCNTKDTFPSVFSCFEECHRDIVKQASQNPRSNLTAEETLYQSFHVTVSPITIFLTGPFLEKSNRVLRRYQQAHQENFLRVEFREEDGLQYRFDRDVNGRAFIKNRLGPILKTGLIVAGREFRFLAYSQSALREHSVWFVRPFLDPDYGEMDASRIVKSLGTFDNLSYDPQLTLCPARYAARLSQAFTSTEDATVKVNKNDIVYIQDVTTELKGIKYAFTDGSGNISDDLAREIWEKIRPRDSTKGSDYPRAYQIRLGGSKGMLSVDYNLNGSRTIALRPSMIKFDAFETGDGKTEIEIARAICSPTPYTLNRPLIMLLDGLGVRFEEIRYFQDKAVKDTQIATQNLEHAATLLDTYGLGSSFRLATTLRHLSKRVITNIQGNPFYDQLLRVAIYHILRDLKNRARIPIPDAWTLVGVADTHMYLEEKEVFACVKKPDGEIIFLDGHVLVSRSPCIHPGDVQVARAIGRPPKGSPFEIEPLQNTVVFSVKGKRPLPSCLGGGDLDGDVYNLLPLATHGNLRPLRYFEPAKYASAEKKKLDEPSTMNDVADFVMEYIVSDVIGIVANAWLVIADQSQFGIQDRTCLKLASLHSNAVDYPKTGNPVNVWDIPRLKFPKPDWSAPETVEPDPVNYYQSQSIIGRLSRLINLDQHDPSLPEDPLNGDASPVINDELMTTIQERVSQYIRLDDISSDELIEDLLSWFSDELLHVALECSLSTRHLKPLHETEIIIGTITQKTSQPQMRKANVSKMRDFTDILVRRVREVLEGDDDKATQDFLSDSWHAWILSNETSRRSKFGVKAFGWVALGGILEALNTLEQSSDE